jgi:hypothetical protein
MRIAGAPLPRSLRQWLLIALLLACVPLAVGYAELAFTLPSPVGRIVLRSLPVLPLAVWTLWLDRDRPLQGASAWRRHGGRTLSLLGIMALAVGLLGFFLNWLYDPDRVL